MYFQNTTDWLIICVLHRRLDDTLRDLIGQLQDTEAGDVDERCERMQDVIDHVLSLVLYLVKSMSSVYFKRPARLKM